VVTVINNDENVIGMKVEDLRNYGVNMHDLSTTVPKKIWGSK
jgi:hypothetical protein